MHNYSRFRVLGTYAKQDTYFSVDFPSEIVACIGGIAFKRSGHGFRSPTVFPAAAVISPPLEPENWGHHNLLRSYMPRHNGKWEYSHREDPSFSGIHTVSILTALEEASSPPIPAPTTCVLAVSREIFFLSCR